jgi:hypothetical protein
LQPCGDIGQFNINAELFGTDTEDSSIESDSSSSLEEVKIDKEGSMQGKDGGGNSESPSHAHILMVVALIGRPWIS